MACDIHLLDLKSYRKVHIRIVENWKILKTSSLKIVETCKTFKTASLKIECTASSTWVEVMD